MAVATSQADPEPAVVEDDDDASIADTPDDIAAALEQRGYAYVALDATTQRRVRELFDASSSSSTSGSACEAASAAISYTGGSKCEA